MIVTTIRRNLIVCFNSLGFFLASIQKLSIHRVNKEGARSVTLFGHFMTCYQSIVFTKMLLNCYVLKRTTVSPTSYSQSSHKCNIPFIHKEAKHAEARTDEQIQLPLYSSIVCTLCVEHTKSQQPSRPMFLNLCETAAR